MTGGQYQFSVESSFESVALLSERIGRLCTECGGGPEVADSLRLCMAEAMNNIVEHAYSDAAGGMIHASVTLSRDRCAIELIDEGRPMPGGVPPQGDITFGEGAIDDLPEGGFGWMLIRSQMDVVSYERRNGCNVLHLEKRLGA